MTHHIYKLALTMVLGSALGFAQMPRQQYPTQSTPPTLPPDNQPQAGAPTHVPPADTAAVQSEIQTALQKDPTLANSNINVQATGKNIELTGTAPSKEAKHTAERIAKAHSGGLDVKDHIKVENAPGGAEPANPKDHNSDK